MVHLHEARGIPARRQPFSGALGGDFGEDVLVAGRFKVQTKRRARWDTLYALLQDANLAFLRADHRDWLVLMPLPMYWLLCEAELRRLAEDR